jgi:hypothetical protein
MVLVEGLDAFPAVATSDPTCNHFLSIMDFSPMRNRLSSSIKRNLAFRT